MDCCFGSTNGFKGIARSETKSEMIFSVLTGRFFFFFLQPIPALMSHFRTNKQRNKQALLLNPVCLLPLVPTVVPVVRGKVRMTGLAASSEASYLGDKPSLLPSIHPPIAITGVEQNEPYGS